MVRVLKYLNLFFFIAMVVINALANILPLGHGNTGAISSKYPNLFTPAPITFSIWGIIYILVCVFIIFQLGVFGDQAVSEMVVDFIGLWFIISCLFNIGWIFSWHYDVIWLSVIMIIGLLFSLIMITSRFSICYLKQVSSITSIGLLTRIGIYAFEIYLGWITAATIANISVFLVKINWNRFMLSEQIWMIVVTLVGTLIGALFITTNQRYLSAAAIIWAYCGILIKHISQSGYGGKYPIIIGVLIFGIAVIIAVGIIKCFMNPRVYT